MTYDLETIDREVIERTKQGHTVGKIAYELRVTRAVVNRSLVRTGVRTPARKEPLDFEAVRDRFMELYHKGYTDRGISRRLRVGEAKARRIREHFGLEANQRFRHDRSTVADLYHKGFSDERIAQNMGSTADFVQKMRLEIGLTRTVSARIPQEKWDEVEALLIDGASYQEAARTTGVSYSAVGRHFPGMGWTMAQRDEYVAMRRLADKLGVTA